MAKEEKGRRGHSY